MNHNRMVLRRCVVLTLALTICQPVWACLWDFDTLKMERRRFPSTLELITGKFLRHSDAYYEWRIHDRIEKLKDGPKLDLQDDLAVAFDKLGRHQQAIETVLENETIRSNRYETEANLGTFYIHKGQLELGLKHIARAIAINPDAHFGREIYQQKLVEYVLSRRQGSDTESPLGEVPRFGRKLPGFAQFLSEKDDIKTDRNAESEVDLLEAIKGIQGMMKFGNYDSPILLEALGDLLLSAERSADAKRLAARAYLKASYEVESDEARLKFRELAETCLRMQTVSSNSHTEIRLEELEQKFKLEIQEAESWFSALVADEERWISEGVDVDAAFAAKYYDEPSLTPEPLDMSLSFDLGPYRIWAYLIGPIILCGFVLVVRRISKRRRQPNTEDLSDATHD